MEQSPGAHHALAAPLRQGAGAASARSLFGIVQGGLHEDLRRRHAEEVCAVDLPGYALGGYSVGEAPEAMHAGVAYSAPLLPARQAPLPHGRGHAGGPGDVRRRRRGHVRLRAAHPLRAQRPALHLRGQGWSSGTPPTPGTRGRWTRPAPATPAGRFSRAYLRHLFAAEEILAMRLNTLHNLHYFLELMAQVRARPSTRTATLPSPRTFRSRESGRAPTG